MSTLNKYALVTGASSGIGRSIARELARAGYHVCATARRQERLESLASEVGDPQKFTIFPADLRSQHEIEALFKHLRTNWKGTLDVVVNSAGLGRVAPLTSGSFESWQEMFDVNVLGLSLVTKYAVAIMRDDGDEGHIIHISSMSGHRVPDGTGAMYSATKHAVKALTEGLRRELRDLKSRIRVCSVSPGFVETEFAEVMTGNSKLAAETYGQYQCLEANDIAQSVLWILQTPPHMQVHDILMRPLKQPN